MIKDLKAFLVLDYSQIEIRILAEVADDALLIQQFNSGIDIHSQVGHTLTGWPVEKIKNDDKVRREIKGMHFGIIYGVSREGLYDYAVAKGVKTTKARMRKYYDAYFAKYKGVAKYIERQRAKVTTDGYADTLFGFRRYIREDPDRNTFTGNQSINSPIQGSAHQLVLIAMALLHTKPKTYRLLTNSVMEIHDALNFRVRFGDLPQAFKLGKQLMETEVYNYARDHFSVALRVPLIAEAKAGFTLGSKVDYNGGDLEEFLMRWCEKYHKTNSEAGWNDLLAKDLEGVSV